jgi:hypothetical protein
MSDHVQKTIRVLEQELELKQPRSCRRFGCGHGRRTGTHQAWALASYRAPDGRPAQPPTRETKPPKRGTNRPKQDTRAAARETKRQVCGTAPGRHPHERPPAMIVKTDDPPSWWVGLSREEFDAMAAARQHAMQCSKEAQWVSVRMIQ